MDDNNKKYLFEDMPSTKALMTMAIPTVVSQVINLIYNMVDTVFIGQTGDAYKTAAITLAFTVYMMTLAFSNLFGIGGGSLIARLMGIGKFNKSKGASSLSFYGSIFISILYSLFVYLYMDNILYFFGASNNTILFAKQYLQLVVVIGSTPVILSMVIAHLLRNTGYSKESSIGLSLGGVLNVILDPIFMFLVFPSGMEVYGAAFATLISNIISFIYLFVIMLKVKKYAPLSIDIKDIKFLDKVDIRSFFGVGIPSAFLTGLFDVANICLNALMALHGDLQLAAIGIVMKTERLPNAINIGVCQGMLPIVAYNYSSNNHNRMNEILNTAKIYGLLISFASLIIYEMFANPINLLFLNINISNDYNIAIQTIYYATIFLRIRCIASPLQFLNFSTSYSMQAVGYGSGTLLHACFRELVFYIPLMFILNYFFSTYGLVSAIIFGEGLGAIFAIILFGVWKKKNIFIFKS